MNKRGIYSLFLISLLVMSLLIGFVSSQGDYNVKADINLRVVNTDSTFYKAVDFFGFNIGETWVEIIVGLIILLIIAAALYDILGIIAFESQAVKLIIAIGIALIASMIGLIRTFSKWAFAVAGGVAALGVAILVIGAVVAFVLVHFGFAGLARRMLMARAGIRSARGAGSAEEAGAALRGFTLGATGRRT